jgi:hypothetical protein
MTTNLFYAITRRTPVSQKVLKWALRAQSLLNEKLVSCQDHLNLAPIGGAMDRPPVSFPFVRVAPMRIGPYSVPESLGDSQAVPTPNAVAAGTTKCRDPWACHIVAAYLRVLSETHPEVTVELRDETGQFVIPMSVFLKAGRFELNREFLNAQRERALETSGDPQAGAAFLWAETRALNGEYLTDMPFAEYMEVPEVVLDMDMQDMKGAMLSELALRCTRNILADVEPALSK